MKIKAPSFWELSSNDPSKTVGQLIRLFYKIHTYKERGKPRGERPITLHFNIPPFVMPDDPFAQDMYIAIYHGLRFAPLARYFAVVEQNIRNPMSGPHACKLKLQVRPGKIIWLASMQFEVNFFDRKKITALLRRAIRLKEYYCPEDSQEEIVVFDKPQPISYDIQ